jgi:hypothetical protein
MLRVDSDQLSCLICDNQSHPSNPSPFCSGANQRIRVNRIAPSSATSVWRGM